MSIRTLLPEFIKCWVDGSKFPYYVQVFDKKYSNQVDQKPGLTYFQVNGTKDPNRQMSTQDWVKHFSQQPEETDFSIYGSYAIPGKFPSGKLKWIAFDSDNKEESLWIMDKLIPWLEGKGISFILEFSQIYRCHLWIFCDNADYALGERLVSLIEKDLGKGTNEVYPFGARANSAIRVIGGWHYWTKCANPCNYLGEESGDPETLMKWVIEIPKLTDEFLQSLNLPEIKRFVPRQRKHSRVEFTPLNLPEPMPGLPETVKSICSNCPAFNQLFKSIPEDAGIEVPGAEYHQTGFRCSALCVYHDIIKEDTAGRKAWADIVQNYRNRSAKSHGWNGDNSFRKYYDNPTFLIPTCATMDADFPGICNGCPHKAQPGFTSPRQLLYSSTVSKRKVGETKLVTLEYMREQLFPEIAERVKDSVESGKEELLQIATPQGSGKSDAADRIALMLADLGYNVILAVPNSDLAAEHSDRCNEYALKDFPHLVGTTHILASHEKTFSEKNPQKLDFNCPEYRNIQYYAKLGCGSSFYKTKFCKKCPFLEKCPYPTQYVKALEPNKKIIILQHAHFRSPAAMNILLTSGKTFNALIIDERFIDNLIQVYKPLEAEILLIEASNYSWSENLSRWLKEGAYPGKEIYVSATDIEEMGQLFIDNGLDPERFRIFREAYNRRMYLSQYFGFYQFYPPPNVPVTIMTDATPSIDKLEVVLNKKVEVIGKGMVIDIKQYHPDNEFISVLDSSISKTALEKDEKFYDILNLIGQDCHFGKHKEERVLVTVYLNRIQETIEYLQEKFPGIDIGGELSGARIIVCGMKIGVNTFIDFTVQYILAAHYLNDTEVVKNTYMTNLIDNHHRFKENRRPIPNIYDRKAMEGGKSGLPGGWDFRPVRKVEKDGIYEYPGYCIRVPHFDRDYWSYVESSGTGQQTARLRVRPGMEKPITTYVFSNEPMEGILNTKVVLFDQLLFNVTI